MRRALLLVGVLVAATASAACGEGKANGPPGAGATKGPRPFPVETALVSAREVDYAVSAVGSLEAFEEVQVTARVAGVVEKVSFTEGSEVKAGQALVDIEPQRFQLAVRAARANLEKAEAALADAQAGLLRREEAAAKSPGLIPGEELVTFKTRVRTAAAEVQAAKVALDRAQLDLRDSYVRAPVAGVLQTRTVKTGQYVQAGTVLGTLVRREPLLLRFDVPEREAGELAPGAVVEFVTGGSESAPYKAKIMLVATAADPTTRMIKVTAHVEDPRQAELRPGAFARVNLSLGERASAVVVPLQAVRPSERGFLAYVVEGGKAVERVVVLGLRTADGMVEIKDGLAPGEELVVRGAEALRPGATVVISGGAKKPENAPQAPPAGGQAPSAPPAPPPGKKAAP